MEWVWATIVLACFSLFLLLCIFRIRQQREALRAELLNTVRIFTIGSIGDGVFIIQEKYYLEPSPEKSDYRRLLVLPTDGKYAVWLELSLEDHELIQDEDLKPKHKLSIKNRTLFVFTADGMVVR